MQIIYWYSRWCETYWLLQDILHLLDFHSCMAVSVWWYPDHMWPNMDANFPMVPSIHIHVWLHNIHGSLQLHQYSRVHQHDHCYIHESESGLFSIFSGSDYEQEWPVPYLEFRRHRWLNKMTMMTKVTMLDRIHVELDSSLFLQALLHNQYHLNVNK